MKHSQNKLCNVIEIRQRICLNQLCKPGHHLTGNRGVGRLDLIHIRILNLPVPLGGKFKSIFFHHFYFIIVFSDTEEDPGFPVETFPYQLTADRLYILL